MAFLFHLMVNHGIIIMHHHESGPELLHSQVHLAMDTMAHQVDFIGKIQAVHDELMQT